MPQFTSGGITFDMDPATGAIKPVGLPPADSPENNPMYQIDASNQVIDQRLRKKYDDYVNQLSEFGRGEVGVNALGALDEAGDQAAMARGEAAYGRQAGSVDLAEQAALGNAPSAAAIQGKQQLDSALQQNLALARSGGGASGMRAALYANAKAGQGATGDAAALRAQEMAAARGQYLQGTQGLAGTAASMRNQGFQRGQAAISSAEASKAREMARQQAALGYKGNVLSTETGARGASIGMQKGQDTANQALGANAIGTGVTTTAAVASPYIDSDPRAKGNIFPAGVSPSGIDMKSMVAPATQFTPQGLAQGGSSKAAALAPDAAASQSMGNTQDALRAAPGYSAPQNQKDLLRDAMFRSGPDMNTVNTIAGVAGAGSQASDMALGQMKAGFKPLGEGVEAIQKAATPAAWAQQQGGMPAPIRELQQAGKVIGSPDKWIDFKNLAPTEADAVKAGQSVLAQQGAQGEIAATALPELAAGNGITGKGAVTLGKQAAPVLASGGKGAAGAAAGSGGGGGALAGLGAVAGKILPFMSDPRAKMNTQPANFYDRVTSAIDAKSGLMPAGSDHAPWGGKETPSLGGERSTKLNILPVTSDTSVGLDPRLLSKPPTHGGLRFGPSTSGPEQTMGGAPAQTGTAPTGGHFDSLTGQWKPWATAASSNTAFAPSAGTMSGPELDAYLKSTTERSKSARVLGLANAAEEQAQKDIVAKAQQGAKTGYSVDDVFKMNEDNRTADAAALAAGKENSPDQQKAAEKDKNAPKSKEGQAFSGALGAIGAGIARMGQATAPYAMNLPQVAYPTYQVPGVPSDPKTKEGQSQEKSPIRDFEEKAKGFTYQYKSPEFEDGSYPAGTRHMGPMADDLRDVKDGVGKTLTYEDPNTGLLGVNTGRLSLANAAAVNDLHERIKQLEAKRSKKGAK